MNSKKTLIFIAFTAAILMAFAFQNSSEHKVLFEKAKFTMETKGDLKGAIKLFSEIIKKYPDEREYAAKSQLYIGLCYEKLGLKQAQKAFQNVIDNYPDQTEAVKVAKEKLNILLKAQAVVEVGDKEFKIRKVCEGPDIDILGEVSPDGRHISYTDWGTGDLAIYEIATGRKRRITKPTEEEPFGFVLRSPWSPDSKKIAYNWHNKDAFWDMRIIGIDGSKPRVLYRDKDVYPQPADWSPDGKYILTIFDNYHKDKINQVGLVSVADGSVSILEALAGRTLYYMYFSPDGHYITYDYPQKEGSQDRDIFLYSIEEKREIPLIQHPADDRSEGWTSDGKYILFGSNRLGTLDAWVILVKEGNPQGDPILVKKEIGSVSPMEFAPDGSFYYGRRIEVRDVYTATFDEGRDKLLAPPMKLTGRFVGNNFSPEWSPGGKYLAYISKRPAAGKDFSKGFGANSLYVLSLESGEEREVVRPQQIRSFGGVSRGLRWSPEGSAILASGYDKKGQGIYIVDVKTGEISVALYGEAQIMDPTWSADGKAIFFTERDWQKRISRIYKYDLKTKQKKEIHHQAKNLNWLALSPDGRTFAFVSWEKDPDSKTGLQALKILPVAGGEPRKVAEILGGNCWTMTWSADSRELFFGKNLRTPNKGGTPKGYELWRISVEGGEPHKICGGTTGGLSELRVHPDGRGFAFRSRRSSAEIWVMENFLPEEKTKNKSK